MLKLFLCEMDKSIAGQGYICHWEGIIESYIVRVYDMYVQTLSISIAS